MYCMYGLLYTLAHRPIAWLTTNQVLIHLFICLCSISFVLESISHIRQGRLINPFPDSRGKIEIRSSFSLSILLTLVTILEIKKSFIHDKLKLLYRKVLLVTLFATQNLVIFGI